MRGQSFQGWTASVCHRGTELSVQEGTGPISARRVSGHCHWLKHSGYLGPWVSNGAPFLCLFSMTQWEVCLSLEYEMQSHNTASKTEVTKSQTLKHVVNHSKNFGLILKAIEKQRF